MLRAAVLLLLAGPAGMTAGEDLFDGPPDPAVKLGAEVSHGRRFFLRTPPGWREPFVLGSVPTWLASPDDDAVVLVHTDDTHKTLHPGAYLGAPLGTSTVKWSPLVPSKIGPGHVPARVQEGSGRIASAWTDYSHSGGGSPWVLHNADKVDRDEAQLWRIVLDEADDGKSYVVLAALKAKAKKQRRAELVACVRSLVWESRERERR
jgi:hypothetical protein